MPARPDELDVSVTGTIDRLRPVDATAQTPDGQIQLKLQGRLFGPQAREIALLVSVVEPQKSYVMLLTGRQR